MQQRTRGRSKSRWPIVAATLLLGACAAGPCRGDVVYPRRPPPQRVTAHDPSIIKDGRFYYVYATGGVPVWRSPDLIRFERAPGLAFPKPPAEALRHVPAAKGKVWAPHVAPIAASRYRLYYCYSEFGTSQSYLGVAEAASPAGPFVAKAAVLRSTARRPPARGPTVNALDPAILIDARGRHWMFHGSSFDGIHVVEIDKRTGLLKHPGAPSRAVARRERPGNIEGAYAIYHPGMKRYYLFVSYDKLDSTYNVRVGRSTRPEGPYLDYRGEDMAGRTNNLPKILNSYRFGGHPGWLGPGHNSVLVDGEDYFIAHHARVEIEGKMRLRTHVRRLVWTDDGWPVVSPQRYAGEAEQPVGAADVLGEWDLLRLAPEDNGVLAPEGSVRLERGGRLEAGGRTGRWKLAAPNTLTCYVRGGEPAGLKVLPAWDWENQRPTLVFTGLNRRGVAYWGQRRQPPAVRRSIGPRAPRPSVVRPDF